MSAAAAPSHVFDHLDFVRAWARNLADLLSQPPGTPLACEVLSRIPDNASARSEGDLWITAALSGALSGELALRLAPADARRLAQRYEGKAEGSDEAVSQDALLALFLKAAALVSTQLKTSGKGCAIPGGFWGVSFLDPVGHLLRAGKPDYPGGGGGGFE
jgi:hypothetical protein